METKRLVIRRMQRSDAGDIYKIRSDPLVRSLYAAEPIASESKLGEWMDARDAGYEKRDGLFFVFAIKPSTQIIGSCCFWNFDEAHLCAEIGYELNRNNWRTGIMSEALPPIVDFGFKSLGLHRIEACPLAYNQGSCKVLEKLGFHYEGRLRQRVHFHGEFIDQLYYSMLSDEWNSPTW
jgi:[ribosomal protein S5]-alanine N-acetyltransferase